MVLFSSCPEVNHLDLEPLRHFCCYLMYFLFCIDWTCQNVLKLGQNIKYVNYQHKSLLIKMSITVKWSSWTCWLGKYFYKLWIYPVSIYVKKHLVMFPIRSIYYNSKNNSIIYTFYRLWIRLQCRIVFCTFTSNDNVFLFLYMWLV